jgi:hypothetical protein
MYKGCVKSNSVPVVINEVAGCCKRQKLANSVDLFDGLPKSYSLHAAASLNKTGLGNPFQTDLWVTGYGVWVMVVELT